MSSASEGSWTIGEKDREIVEGGEKTAEELIWESERGTAQSGIEFGY